MALDEVGHGAHKYGVVIKGFGALEARDTSLSGFFLGGEGEGVRDRWRRGVKEISYAKLKTNDQKKKKEHILSRPDAYFLCPARTVFQCDRS